MKITLKTLFVGLLASFIMISCGGDTSEKNNSHSETPAAGTPRNADQVKAVKYKVDAENSSVEWTGTKFGVYDHTGTLKVSKGDVELKGTEVVGGGVVVDMKSMATTDDNYGEENPSSMLLGHLASGDFFDVEKFPIATLVFTQAGEGSLSIKDKTNKVKYTNVKVDDAPNGKMISAKAEFNRQDYGVTFKIGEAVANDIVKLEVKLMLVE